jgi:hypothetical protein
MKCGPPFDAEAACAASLIAHAQLKREVSDHTLDGSLAGPVRQEQAPNCTYN